MSDYSKNLGESIFRNRKLMKMTQSELAEKAGVTEQTIRKIEHGEGNPQLDVLCSLLTTLGIDPKEILYPRHNMDDPARKQLEVLLANCNEEQIRGIIPAIEAIIKLIKSCPIDTP